MKSGLWAALLCVSFAWTPLLAQSISAEEAKQHVGERATVCGRVASERRAPNSKGQPTFLNLDGAYPHQVFTVVVWGEDRSRVGELPLEGAHLCVKGIITEYKGVPEIVVREKNQIAP